MTKSARAAELWARLEKRLINRCGLPNGRMLDVERPNLIRCIGSAITGRAAAVTNVSPPLPQQDAYAKRIKVRQREMRLPTALTRGFEPVGPGTGGRKPGRDDTIHDARLASMLERSCSRRTGYDGDDTVSYERG